MMTSTNPRRWVAAALLPWVVACAKPRDQGDPTGPPSASTGSGPAGSDTQVADADSGDKLDVAPPSDGPTIPDGGNGSCDQDVDIVFVMDVSTTMGPFLNQLAAEILFVDEALDAMELPNPPHYGLVVFVDDVALLNGGVPYDSVALLQQDFLEWSDFTSSNQQVGGPGTFNSTWPENSLDAMVLGATGFQWRPAETTLRVILHTTDDTFWEGPATENGVDIVNDFAGTVAALQQREIRDFTFAAQIGGSCSCEDVTPGWSSPFQGMEPIPVATGGDVFDIDLVLAGQVSLADAIEDAVESTMCEPYPPVG